MLYFAEAPSSALSQKISRVQNQLQQTFRPIIRDSLASYQSLWIGYDCIQIGYGEFKAQILEQLNRAKKDLTEKTLEEPLFYPAEKSKNTPGASGPASNSQRHNKITKDVLLPVYYGDECALDIQQLAADKNLSTEDIINIHLNGRYQVYTIGFAPGFAYLGEVDARIASPRLTTPRAQVPKGSVGIADRQTAIYPAVSPGGWNIIGNCPIQMFNPNAQPCMPLATGDSVRFRRIERDEFLALGGQLGQLADNPDAMFQPAPSRKTT